MDDIYGNVRKVVSDFGGRANARNFALQIFNVGKWPFTSSIDKNQIFKLHEAFIFWSILSPKNPCAAGNPSLNMALILKEITAFVSPKIDEKDTFIWGEIG